MRICRSALILAAVCTAATAQETTRADRWREDIALADQFVRTTHPNLYANVDREAFNEAKQQLEAALDTAADYEAAIGLARLLALAGDAHTNLSLRAGIAGIRQYPIRLQWFDEGLFVTQAAQPNIRALGKRVVRIAGMEVEEAYSLARTAISHENDAWARQRTGELLASPEVLHALRITSELGGAEYSIEDADGSVFTIAVAPGSAALFAAPHLARPRNPVYLHNPAQYYWFDYFPESRTIYMKYNVCSDSPALPMADFTRELVSFGEANAVERMIFDLRNNTGGNSAVIRPLLNALRDAGRRGTIRPRQVAAIIGRQTFSSGMLNAIDLKMEGAVLVGQPTGGRPRSYGEIRAIVLPNSQITVSCSTRLFEIPGFTAPALAPDVAVPYSAADYFADRDPALDAALAQ